MTDAIETNLGRKPEQLSADSGYCSNANIEALETRGIDGYIAPGRTKDAADGAAAADLPADAAPPAGDCPAASPEPAAPQRASRPCARKSRPAVTTAPTGCASSCPNRCSGRSSRRAASASSCCGAGEGASGMGHCLPRPQSAEAGSGAGSVRAAVHGPRSKAGGCLRPSVATLGVKLGWVPACLSAPPA